MVQQRTVVALTLTLLAAAASGCSDGEVADAADASGGADAVACSARSADGACCPPGALVDAAGACVALGPPACGVAVQALAASVGGEALAAEPLSAALAACVPRWCADWRDAAGGPCDPTALGCHPAPRACTPAELAAGAGCPAGEWPAQGGACALAGRADRVVDAAGVAAVPDDPDLRWCWDLARADGGACGAAGPSCWPQPRSCTPGELASGRGCDAGTWPRAPQHLDAPQCVAAGVPWTCPDSFVADPTGKVAPGGLPACRPDPARCGAGPWPAGVLPSDTVYVSALAAPGGDGSEGLPFRTISAGIDAAPTGGTVAVAAGLYDEALLLKRSIQLRGRCASLVRVRSATVSVLGVNATASPGDALVEDLALTSTESAGVNVLGPLRVELRHVWVDGPRLFGFNVGGAGAELTLTNSLVNHVRVKAKGYAKCGQTGDKGRLALVGTRLTGCRINGLDVTGAGVQAWLSNVLIDGVQTQEGAQTWGDGISVRNGAQLRARGLRVHGTHLSGVAGSETSGGTWLQGVLVDEVFTGGLDENATSGLFAPSGTRLEAAGFVVKKVPFVGVLLVGAQDAALFGGVVEHMQAQAGTGVAGLGVMAWQGATVRVAGLRINRARSVGIRVRGADTTLRAERVVITATQPRVGDGTGGGGVHVLDGGRVDLEDAALHDNHWIGLFARGAGTELRAARVVITGMRSTPAGVRDGDGFVVADGASLRLRQLHLTGARTVGGLVDQPGSRVALAGAYVADTQVDELGTAGRGLWVQLGGQLELVGSRVSRNIESGVGCTSAGSKLVLAGSQVDHNVPGEGERGHGMGIVTGSGCDAQVSDALVEANHSAGVAFHLGNGAVARSVIRGTLGAGYTKTGSETVTLADGIVAREVQSLSVTHTLTYGHKRAGVLVDAAGTPSAVLLTGVASVSNLFGLVAQGAVQVTQTGTVFAANSAQNEVTDQALTLAPPPDAATFEP